MPPPPAAAAAAAPPRESLESRTRSSNIMPALELFDEFMPGTDQYEVEEEVGHGTFSEVGLGAADF